MLGPDFVSLTAGIEPSSEIMEEEPTISVVFWSIAFVLLLIVTVWFYITQIAPAHSPRAHRTSPSLEDKAEQVAKRILEQLQVTECSKEVFPGEKRVDCRASGGGNLGTVYEYVDDEIHIHYSKNAWENDAGEQMNGSGTRRRRSMDEMELIFPGFLPIIKEEEEGEALDDYEGKELLIDSFQKREQRQRAPDDIENNPGKRKLLETTAKKTAVVKPGSHQVTTTKHWAKGETEVTPRGKELDKETASVNPVDKHWRLEPVQIGNNEPNLLHEVDRHLGTGVTQVALDEYVKPAVHASLEEPCAPPASLACVSALDVEMATSARNAIPPQGSNKVKRDGNESNSVFTLESVKSSPDSKQTSDDYSPISVPDSFPVIKVAKVGQSNGRSMNISSKNEKDLSNAEHSDKKAQQTEEGNRDGRDGKPLEISQGLAKDNSGEIDYACEMNGITNGSWDEPEAKRTPTTHAWTFFSMSETSELLCPELEPLDRPTGGERSFANSELPSIVVDSYDDRPVGKCDQGHMHSAEQEKEPSLFTNSFETDIDVDEIDIDEFEFEDEGEFGLHFKRHVSVTDLDKILSGENSADRNGLDVEGDDIPLANGNDSDDITCDPYQYDDTVSTDEPDIVNKFDFWNRKDPINTRNSDKESQFSEPEQDQQKIPHIDECVITSTLDSEIQESEPANSVTFRLDQLIEQSRISSHDLDDDNLETFCEELSDLIDECKNERRPRLFTIPEEVEVADGIFVDRVLQRGAADKVSVIVEPRSDSAPIATEEMSDLDFDLEETDEVAIIKLHGNVSSVETLELESIPCVENVTAERGDILEDQPQTSRSEITDKVPLNSTKNSQKEARTLKEARAVFELRECNDDSVCVTEIAAQEVTAGEICDENENYRTVSNTNYLKLECAEAPAFEWATTEKEEARTVKADLFCEEGYRITECPEIKPTLTVSDVTSAPSCYQIAETEEQMIKPEEICRFQEGQANATRVESGYVEVTPKREKGFRVTRVTVVKQKVKNDPELPAPVTAKSANSRPHAFPVSKPIADALPVTKVTVQQVEVTEGEMEARKSSTEIQTNNEESPSKYVGLKVVVTGRRTGSQNDLSESYRGAEREGLSHEGRASPDSGRTSPLRSSLTPAEGPRKTFQSAHRIRLTKSHEDLSLAGLYKRNEPRRVIVKEGMLHAEEPCAESTPSAPSPQPAIPEDEAIESFQPPKIHKAKITVSETIGNKTRVTILNVQKRVTGNARWKSLNDLDSFGSPLPPTNEASRMSWSGEESSSKGPGGISSSSLNNQRFGRGESGYGSLDFERKTPSPPTGSTTQPKETIFAVSAEPVAFRRIASIEEETEGSSTDLGDELLGDSTVRVTDLDSALLSAHTTPQTEVVDSEEISVPDERDQEAIVKVRGYEDESCHLVATYSALVEAVPLEAVILPQTTETETQEDAPVITAFPVNDGYEDEELDDVFCDNRLPTRDNGSEAAPTPRYSDGVADFHSSDADSETSSVHSITLKHRHLHTRASLEASCPRIPRLSDSTDSSHTATPITELENDPFESFSQSSISNAKPTPGQSTETTPRNSHSRSTTEIDKESSNIASAFVRVQGSRTHEQLNRRSPTGVQKDHGFAVREYEQQLFRDQAESRKSMPDLSAKFVAMDDSPYLRGLSSHTKRWLSQNFMSPATFSDEDDMLGSEMFLHPASFINLADDDDASIASVSTRPQSPMSEFSFAGEIPYACQQRETRTVVKCAYTRCGREEVLLGRQKTSFTSCPACFTYYCNRDCRRVHWSEHKKVCFFGRINSYVRSFVYHTEKRENLKFALSKVATDGYKKSGRGCVMVIFGSPQAARKFMTTGCTFFPSPPSYSSYAKVKAEGVISRHKEVLLQLIKDHDPTQEFVLNLAIIAGTMENLPSQPVPRRKVNTVLQCVKIPLSERLIDSSPNGLDASPETKVFHLPKCSRHEFVNEIEARRHYCRNISKELKQYGIKLKKDYPLVYDKLCQYVEKGRPFEAQSLLGSRVGRVVACKIMPEL